MRRRIPWTTFKVRNGRPDSWRASSPTVGLTSSSGRSNATRQFFEQLGKWSNWRRKSNIVESPDYKELLQALNDCEVEYLIVGVATAFCSIGPDSASRGRGPRSSHPRHAPPQVSVSPERAVCAITEFAGPARDILVISRMKR